MEDSAAAATGAGEGPDTLAIAARLHEIYIFFARAGIQVLGYDTETQAFNGGFVPDILDTDEDVAHTLYVNAWDPWSMIGNGNGRDNSLDGYWGRCSNMAVLGWSVTNPWMMYRAVG